jgi:hypothetical protein
MITKNLKGKNVTMKKATIRNMKKPLLVFFSCHLNSFSAFSMKFENTSRKNMRKRNFSMTN